MKAYAAKTEAVVEGGAMGSPDTWRVVWVLAAAFFVVAEMVRRLRFFFLPFAVGAGAAAIAAFAGTAVAVEWLIFLLVSVVGLAVLLPVGRKLSAEGHLAPVGSNRWTGQHGVVVEDVPGHLGDTGVVRIGRETWRAETGYATAIPAGTEVFVTRVEGTRLVVLPVTFPTTPSIAPFEEGS
jgi:membrane protein implicated in regulation of membrane protease activity